MDVLRLGVSITMASATHTTTRPPDATATIILTRRLTRLPINYIYLSWTLKNVFYYVHHLTF